MRALITGATSGIGHQLAKDYLEDGHTVYCCGRQSKVLETLQVSFQGLAEAHSFDTASLSEVQGSLQHIPHLDTVILNAGTCEYVDASKFDAELLSLIHI